ncbi:hypothetical protein D3C71_1710590 [compost metagenome]
MGKHLLNRDLQLAEFTDGMLEEMLCIAGKEANNEIFAFRPNENPLSPLKKVAANIGRGVLRVAANDEIHTPVGQHERPVNVLRINVKALKLHAVVENIQYSRFVLRVSVKKLIEGRLVGVIQRGRSMYQAHGYSLL